MEPLESMLFTHSPTEALLLACLDHIRFAGFCFAVDRLIVGITRCFGWKDVLDGRTRMELFSGIWMFRVFLVPFG